MSSSSLLTEIQKISGVGYLSDMHKDDFSFSETARQGIKAIPEDLYSLEDWNVATSYILGETCELPSIAEAKTAIVFG